MPVGRYIAFVGTCLVILLLVANWWIPDLAPQPSKNEIEKPVIRITSTAIPLERVVIDTSQPIVVPPVTVVADSAVSAQPPEPAVAEITASPLPVTASSNGPVPKKQKVVKRETSKRAAIVDRPASSPNFITLHAGPAHEPITKLSLMDAIAERLRSTLSKLN